MVGRISQYSISSKALFNTEAVTASKARVTLTGIHNSISNVKNSPEKLTKTDEKTVHKKDIKALKSAFDNLSFKVKQDLDKLNNNKGWNRPDRSYTTNALNGFHKKIQETREKLTSSTYQHNPGKAKALDQLEAKIEHLAAKSGHSFDVSDKQLKNQKIIAEGNAWSKASSKAEKELREENLQHYLRNAKVGDEHPNNIGGMGK